MKTGAAAASHILPFPSLIIAIYQTVDIPLLSDLITTQLFTKMAEKDELVQRAKLAEQAER